jgi:hypothetical protein
MRQRRGTVEHPFATLKMRMGATHLLMKRLRMCLRSRRAVDDPRDDNAFLPEDASAHE